MISVKLELTPYVKGKGFEALKKIPLKVNNHKAEVTAKRLKELLVNISCTDHPEANQTVLVKSDLNGVSYTSPDICCKDFKKKISLVVTRVLENN